MKKLILIAIIVIITGLLYFRWGNNNEKLYDLAVQYLIDHDNNPERFNEAYKLFIDYHDFGIREDDKYSYAYMWILAKSYYLENNEIISGSGSSMAYKFVFDKDEDRVIKYELPMDGSYYVSSIKKMFPRDIAKKVLSFSFSDDNLRNQVKQYYSNY